MIVGWDDPEAVAGLFTSMARSPVGRGGFEIPLPSDGAWTPASLAAGTALAVARLHLALDYPPRAAVDAAVAGAEIARVEAEANRVAAQTPSRKRGTRARSESRKAQGGAGTRDAQSDSDGRVAQVPTGEHDANAAAAAGEGQPATAPAIPLPEPGAERFVVGSSVNLRETPGDGTILLQLRIGTHLTVLDARDRFAEVRTDRGDVGWIAMEFISDGLPSVEYCLSEARAAATPRDALTWYLRAEALAPWDLEVLTALEATYRAVGEPGRADEIAQRSRTDGPLVIASCGDGACEAWLELGAGGFRPFQVLSGGLERLRARTGWYFLLPDGESGWFTVPPQGWEAATPIVRDPLMSEGLLLSRLVRPLRVDAEVPAPADLRAWIGSWMRQLEPRPAWIPWSRTGAGPVTVKARAVSGGPEPILAIEAGYQIDALGSSLKSGLYRGVLLVRVRDRGLELLAAEGFLASALPRGQAGRTPRSAQLLGVVDLDGDGQAEVLLSSDGGPGSRDAHEYLLWREAGDGTWFPEVSARSCQVNAGR